MKERERAKEKNTYIDNRVHTRLVPHRSLRQSLSRFSPAVHEEPCECGRERLHRFVDEIDIGFWDRWTAREFNVLFFFFFFFAGLGLVVVAVRKFATHFWWWAVFKLCMFTFDISGNEAKPKKWDGCSCSSSHTQHTFSIAYRAVIHRSSGMNNFIFSILYAICSMISCFCQV